MAILDKAGINTAPLRGVFCALVAALLAAVGTASCSGGDNAAEGPPSFAVRRGPLTISVTESGTVKARERVVIKSEVEGKTTILSLVPEGTLVEEGELLLELDASSLEDQKVEQEIRVLNAEAAFIRARENVEVVRSQGASDMDKAKLKLRFANEDLKKFKEGEFPQKVRQAEAKVTLAEEELSRAEEKLKWSKVLFEEKYLSQSELQADELSANKARLDLELAREELKLLKTFSYDRDLAQLESDVKQNAMALERIERKAAADVVQAEAELRAKESEYNRQQSKLKKNLEQIAKTRIYAPTSGLVVYATSAQATWRGNVEPLEEGQQVRERQELIYLPKASSFMAEVKVHESSLKKISVGLPARLTIDALPGKVFTGKVAKIAPLPDAQSIFLNPDLKVYRTEVHIDGDGSELRTGMSTRAEIIVTRYEDVLYVPVQAVIRVGGEPTVFVREGAEWKARTVKTALDNNRMIHIMNGLEEGEEVLLTPPLAAGEVVTPVEDGESEEDRGADRERYRRMRDRGPVEEAGER